MRNCWKRYIFLILVFWIWPPPSSADERNSGLQHDPFRMPQAVIAPPLAKEPIIAANATPQNLELRGTLISNVRSLANVGGEIVAVGAEIDGFKLVSVREGSAVFERGGDSYTLDVGGHEAEGRDD